MFRSKEPEIFGNVINHLKGNLADFTNSYNCNLFVYTIRKCLQFESKLASNSNTVNLKAKLVKTVDENNNEIFVEELEDDTFSSDLLKALFAPECCPKSYFLIDGDFPRRNVMHYAANYNCSLIPSLILKDDRSRSTDLVEICRQVLDDLTSDVCSIVDQEAVFNRRSMNFYQGKFNKFNPISRQRLMNKKFSYNSQSRVPRLEEKNCVESLADQIFHFYRRKFGLVRILRTCLWL